MPAAVTIDLVPLITGLLVAIGGGAGIGKAIESILKLRSGMSARENQRKLDIVQQRDAAIARETRAWKLVDSEAEKRRQAQEYASRLRRQIIEAGGEPDAEPVYAATLTKAQLKELREKEES